MSKRDFPPIKTVHGLIDDRASLPREGAVGDAWYEEHAGLLWVWDNDLETWRDLNLWHGRGFAASVASLVGLGAGAVGVKGDKGTGGERGATGLVGPQGERGPAGPRAAARRARSSGSRPASRPGTGSGT